MDLGTLKTHILRRLHMPDYNAIEGGETALTEYINLIIDELSMESGIEETYWDSSVAASTTSLRMPTDWVRIRRVTWDGKDINITSMENLNTEDERFQLSTATESTPTDCYVINSDVLYLDPVPDEAGTLRVYGVQIPDDLSGSTDATYITRTFPNTIVLGVRWLVHDELDDIKAADSYSKYQISKRMLIGKVKTAQGHRSGMRSAALRKYRRKY